MSKRDFSLYIVDIFIAIDKINRYSEKIQTAKEFFDNEMVWDATIRELEIIGEATNYLLKAEIIDQKYRRIVDFRNQIVHGYFGIDADIVYEVIREKLPEYSKDLLVASAQQKEDVLKAIQSSKIENQNSTKILTFLSTLEEQL